MSSLYDTGSHEDPNEGLIDKTIADYLEKAHSAGSEQIRPLREEFLARNPEFKEKLMAFFKDEDVFRLQESLPYFGDDYEVLKEIGRGGRGIVYKVRQKSLNKIVAIKTIIGDPSDTPRDLERIREEALKVAGLRHANIVPVHYVDITGRFFVMDYIEGKNLDDFVSNQPLSAKRAIEYLKPVADAIHHAHQRGILHCDVNPRNILIEQAEEEEKPYVTDFDLANRIGENGGYLPSAVKGTLAYMAPEQVTKSELTTATDIYGLGGILYRMLTGRPPFQVQQKSWQEIEKLLLEESPAPPGKWNSKVDKDLEAICLRCLNKDKDRRYGSAYGLKRDLERYEAGEKPEAASPEGPMKATSRWCHKNPGPTLLISAVALIAILTVALALLTAKDRKTAQLREALQSNRAAAEILAGNAFSEIRDLSVVIEKAANDQRLIHDLSSMSEKAAGAPGRFQRFEDMNNPDLEQYVETLCNNAPPSLPFQDCFVLDERGREVADYRLEPGKKPQHEKTRGDLSWRDYFYGAKAQSKSGNSVHIGKAYRSKTDQFYKLPISAPILNSNREFLGVICIALRTDRHLGLVIPGDPSHKVALIAPEDREDIADTGQSQPVILFHPAYKPGFKPVYIKSPVPSTQTTDDYTDPVGFVQGEYKGRWIAGFAHVGDTAIVIVAQQRYDEAMKSDPSTRYLRVWTFGVLLLAIGTLFVWLWLRGSSARG